MAREKSKDDDLFNCSQEHEKKYVSYSYGDKHEPVYAFLEKACLEKTIRYSTHMEVYELIESHLGFPIPKGL